MKMKFLDSVLNIYGINFQTSGFSCFTTQKSQVPKVASQPFPPCLIENIELMLQSKQS